MGRGTLLFRASLGDVLRAERMRQGMTLRELSSLARVSLRANHARFARALFNGRNARLIRQR